MSLYRYIYCLIGLLLSVSTQAETQRWYTPEQAKQGKALFTEHCAQCHGPEAASVPNWREKNAEGKYPPPPLNGTAHAWHHPMPLLRRTIREGGAPVGGVMPPFKDKLDATQIDAVIASFQSYWGDELYTAWLERNQGQAPAPSVPAVNLKWLQQQIPEATADMLKPTPVKGLQQIKVGSRYAYLLDDGRYLLVGDLFDLQNNENLTLQQRQQDTLKLLTGFSEQDMTVYPTTSEEKAVLTVLTDTTCPYCRKLHKDLPQLRQAGVTVRYIPFPRGGAGSEGYRQLSAVWCAENRQQAMDNAFETGTANDKSDCPATQAVQAGFELGQAFKIQGTPTIIMQDGQLLAGYRSVTELLQRLGLGNKP